MSHQTDIFRGRVERVRALVAESGLDAIVIGQPANRQYFTGFSWHDESSSASVGWIVLSPTESLFLTTFNHAEAASATIPHLDVIVAKGRLADTLVDVLGKIPGSRVALEGEWVNLLTFTHLRERVRPGLNLETVDGLVESLRVAKDTAELDRMRHAIALTDQVYTDIVAGLRPGQTERQIAWGLERALRERGADGMAFGPVVAAGANAAIPHHESTDYTVGPGEPIWIDFGAKFGGYCADLTRSFCLGHASSDYLQTWELVREAEDRALAGLREGLSGKAVDAFARDYLSLAGRADEFGHGLGHGLGLMIHEAPRISTSSDDILRSGMVVTIEPGLYRTGWGGIRLEDVALVQPNGCLVLSHAPKAPVIPGKSG